MAKALGPESRNIAMAPAPGGVQGATMVLPVSAIGIYEAYKKSTGGRRQAAGRIFQSSSCNL